MVMPRHLLCGCWPAAHQLFFALLFMRVQLHKDEAAFVLVWDAPGVHDACI
jgi:hypothetical protein